MRFAERLSIIPCGWSAPNRIASSRASSSVMEHLSNVKSVTVFRREDLMKIKRQTASIFLLLLSSATANAAGQYDDATGAAITILNRSSVDEERPPANGAIAKFIDYLRGNEAILKPSHNEVCDAWKTTPNDSPFTGRFWAGGLEFSLDKMCGPKRP
jgi:hypothetical protein